MTGSPPAALRPRASVPPIARRPGREFDLEVHGDIDGLEVTGVTLALVRGPHPATCSSACPGATRTGRRSPPPPRRRRGRDPDGCRGRRARRRRAACRSWSSPRRASRTRRDRRVDLSHRREPGRAVRRDRHERQDQRRRTCSRHPAPARPRHGTQLDGRAPHRRRAPSPARLTTPEASELHALLARMREVDVRAVAVEVSRAGAHRATGSTASCSTSSASPTSPTTTSTTTPSWRSTSRRSSSCSSPNGRDAGVVTIDSRMGPRVVAESRIPVTTLSHESPTSTPTGGSRCSRRPRPTRRSCSTGTGGRRLETRVPLIGWHMAANAALAIVMLVESGFDLEADRRTCSSATAASTPTSPAAPSASRATAARSCTSTSGTAPTRSCSTLGAIRQFTTGKLIMLFGADGDRDTTKRAEMGAIAARGADVVVITDLHPRFEDPAAIRATLIAGARDAVPEREIHEIARSRARRSGRRSSSRARATRSSRPVPATRTTATSRACASRTQRETTRAGTARGGLGR